MKAIQKIIIAAGFLLLYSCPTESDSWDAKYKIKNNTNNNVTLRIFKFFENGNFEDYLLLENESFLGNITSTRNYDFYIDNNNTLPSNSFLSDSIYIVFNNVRIKKHINSGIDGNIQFSAPENRNLFRGGNYSNIGNDIYQITLTEEDFDNATPCNGDCLD